MNSNHVRLSDMVSKELCKPPRKDISGLRFGRLVAIEFYGRRNRTSFYKCVCDCGKIAIIKQYSLEIGKTTSCGCYHAENNRRVHLIDISGKKFGRLTVTEFSHTQKNGTYWKVVCDCGKEKIASYMRLAGGLTKSCGCLRREMMSAKRGEKSHLWRGGKGYYEYPREWNKSLKESIRNRDDRKCQYPNCDYTDALEKNPYLDVHHIDGNKQDCRPKNLISLCHSHHMKIETSGAKNWEEYFYSIIRDYEYA